MSHRFFFGILCAVFLGGCASSSSFKLAPAGMIPETILQREGVSSAQFSGLRATYGKGERYERAKINYLLSRTRTSGLSFYRNGHIFDARMTAKHLTKKYQKRLREITTARSFIKNIATQSSTSGKDYLVIVDGLAYPTGDVLNAELDYVEVEMARHYDDGA